MANDLQLLQARLMTDGAQVRRETRFGRSYLVAPAVSLRQMVLNQELLLAEEFGRQPAIWNGIPVVINHPTDAAGSHISANSPDLESVGRVFNAGLSEDRLTTEVWIDLAAAVNSAEGREVVTLLERGATLEQSLGYWRALEIAPGVHVDGAPYIGVARSIVPDHLAILMDGVGACSIRDGCGILRANEELETMGDETTEGLQTEAEAATDLLARLERLETSLAQFEQRLATNAAAAAPCREQWITALRAAGFADGELADFTDIQLQLLARKHAPADYSGRGGTPADGAPRVLGMPAIWN